MFWSDRAIKQIGIGFPRLDCRTHVLNCENEIIDQGRSYMNMNVDISDCSFLRFMACSGSGGVISVSGNGFEMYVSSSMFTNCSCSSSGGAIYFDSQKSVIKMICAFRCQGTEQGQFGYLKAVSDNQALFVSIVKSSFSTSGLYPMIFFSGDQRAISTNSSMNCAKWGSGIGVWSENTFFGSSCLFSNNTASDCICLYFSRVNANLSYTCIVNNNSPSRYGVIYVYLGKPLLEYIICDLNKNILFCVDYGQLVLANSYVSHVGTFSTSKFVDTLKNNSFIKYPTYKMQFFKSQNCNADDPIIMTPAPSKVVTIINTPQSSPDITVIPTPVSTLIETQENTPSNTKSDTLIQTPHFTPYDSPEQTSKNTDQQTPYVTSKNSPNLTPEKTGEQTLHPTNDQTLFETFLPTPISSLVPTVESTKSPSPIESPTSSNQNTILPTSDESSRHQFVQIAIYSSISLLVVIIIFILLYSAFKKKDGNENSNEEFTNKTQNSKEGSVYWKQLVEQ